MQTASQHITSCTSGSNFPSYERFFKAVWKWQSSMLAPTNPENTSFQFCRIFHHSVASREFPETEVVPFRKHQPTENTCFQSKFCEYYGQTKLLDEHTTMVQRVVGGNMGSNSSFSSNIRNISAVISSAYIITGGPGGGSVLRSTKPNIQPGLGIFNGGSASSWSWICQIVPMDCNTTRRLPGCCLRSPVPAAR